MKKAILSLALSLFMTTSNLFGQVTFYYQNTSQQFTLTNTGYVHNFSTGTAYWPNDSAMIIIDWNDFSMANTEHFYVDIDFTSGFPTLGHLIQGNNFPLCHQIDTIMVPASIIANAVDQFRYYNQYYLKFRLRATGYSTSSFCFQMPFIVNKIEIIYPQMYPFFTVDNANLCEGDTARFHDINTHPAVQRLWRFPGGVPDSSMDPNPLVTYPGGAGNYGVTLIVSNQFGSDSIVTNNVIQILPGGTVNAGSDVTICEGDSIQLNASSSGLNYVWLFDSTISNPFSLSTFVNPSITNSYVLWSGGWSNCSSYDTMTVIVIPPIIPVISNNGNTLQSSMASTYQWYLNNNAINGENSQIIYPQQSGYYSVQTIDANGCSSTSDSTYYTTTGIGMSDASTCNIYYDKHSNEIHVHSNNIQISSVEIYTVSGHSVLNKKYYENHFHITTPCNFLSNGIYFVKVKDKNGRESVFRFLYNQ
ncbi:MAG: T9SS type A sorting domain-containing protein [Bacteroidetes bacterium]|nr:T9SS type A sorting domain-containing protein [Bacteroidota bacterium]